MSVEIIYFGFPGPLHNLVESKGKISYPQNTALEWLDILKTLNDLGVKIAILPPHERPHIATLKFLGFTGQDSDVIAKSSSVAPELFAACTSSTFIKAGNTALATSSGDSSDNRVHITPANLTGAFSRTIEATFSTKLLKILFPDKVNFTIHEPLPRSETFADEGSANHLSFNSYPGGLSIHLFAYGKYALKNNAIEPRKYPALQTYEAQTTNRRKHRLYSDRVLYAQQSSSSIDLGAPHLNKIAMGNNNLFMYHETSFISTPSIVEELKKMVDYTCRTKLITLEVPGNKIDLEESIASSLFESLYVYEKDKGGYLICQEACKHLPAVANYLDEIRASPGNPITDIHYVNISGTLQFRGGPSSFGFKVPLTSEQSKGIKQSVLFSDRLYERLRECVLKNYREEVKYQDLSDPKLLEQNHQALDEISKILDLGSIYDFQKSTSK